MTTKTTNKHLKLNSPLKLGLNWALAATAIFSAAALPVMAEDAPPPKVHILADLEFANEYLTPRGLIVVNQGLTIQPLVLGLVNVYKGDSFINDVTLVPGVWADLATAINGPRPGFAYSVPVTGQNSKGYLNEIDPILGVSTTFAKDYTLSFTYTAFISQLGEYPTSQHLETKFTYNDSGILKAFALHPTVIYWQELRNKATVGPIAGNRTGGYFDLGISPGYTFEKAGHLKVELPIRTLIPVDDRFYGRSGIGLYEVGIKGTLPLDFMPKGYGGWSFHAGVKYMRFLNDNLITMNNSGFLAEPPGSHKKDTVQVYAGISTFF